MFKYLWMAAVIVPYIWWTFEAIKELIKEIIHTKKCHKRFNFAYVPDTTFWYIIVHSIAILAWSLLEFILYYSKK